MCRQYLPPHGALISRAREPAVKAWKMDPFARFYPAAGLFNDNHCKTPRGNMKIRLIVALLGLAISFTVPPLAQQKGTVDPQINQQIRALAMNYDAAINRHDAPAIAALYAQDAVWATYHDGTYHGPQAIEREYERLYFKRWNKSNYITTVNRVSAVGNEILSFGTWSCNYQGNGSVGSDSGHYRWIIVREGDTWKIRRDIMSGEGHPSY